MVAKLGAVIPLPNRKKLATLIVPSAYLPASFPCPALRDDHLCGIQSDKPLRCRSMPFYPYREEQYQAELLKFPATWACDTSATAPVVFEKQRILQGEDFQAERQALQQQQPLIQRYADYTLKYNPKIVGSLAQTAQKAQAGQVVTSLSSFLTAIRAPNSKDIAGQQQAVLQQYLEKTANQKAMAEFHQYYQLSAKEMAIMATR